MAAMAAKGTSTKGLNTYVNVILQFFILNLHKYFQVSPEMLDRVKVQALAGPLKDIQRLALKPLLHYLGCVLKVVILLEGEPSPQSEVLSTLEQVFIKDLSVLYSVHLSLVPT